MIVAVCADKGSPGVTTLATALAVVWPGQRLLLEADPSGADLPLRVQRPGGVPVRSEPSVLSLAADARLGLGEAALGAYAQPTTVEVPLIPGALSAEAFLPMRALWPAVAAEAARWPGTVIADLGRLQPGHSGVSVAKAAVAVVLVARPDVPGLFHLRDRVRELSVLFDEAGRDRSRLVVAVVARPKDRQDTIEAVTRVLAGLALDGSPSPLVGAVTEDPEGVAALYSGRMDRRVTHSALYRSATALAQELLSGWPQLRESEADRAGSEPGVAVAGRIVLPRERS